MTQIRILPDWNEVALQTSNYAPLNSARVLLDWTLPSGISDYTLPPGLEEMLTTAFLRCGNLAFCWCGSPEWCNGVATVHNPKRMSSRLVRIFGSIFPIIRNFDSPSIVLTSTSAVAVHLFKCGLWANGLQRAFVYDPLADLSADLLTDLAKTSDWRNRALPVNVRALFAAGVDGDVALLAASDTSWLSNIIKEIQDVSSVFGFQLMI